jgi:hypothetical protein
MGWRGVFGAPARRKTGGTHGVPADHAVDEREGVVVPLARRGPRVWGRPSCEADLSGKRRRPEADASGAEDAGGGGAVGYTPAEADAGAGGAKAAAA